MALDPLRDPIHDRAGHEAGHLAGLRWFGYTADVLRLDLRYADFGFFGGCDGVRRMTGAEDREAFDRATIAALGPLYGGESLDDRSAATDRRCIDLNVTDGWDLEAWRWLATERARDLARTPAFAATWRGLVVRLGDIGDEYVELRGDEVDQFIGAAVGVPVVA